MRHGKPTQRPCARPGCEGIVNRRDTVTPFCSRACARAMKRGTHGKILINGERHAVPRQPPTSWWLDPEAFYQHARDRFPADAGNKTSEPVPTIGTLDPAFTSRGRRVSR